MKKAVTIKDIAEALNLSRNTVAKALNGQYVPEKTRAQVLEKAAEMKYKSLDIKHGSAAPHYRILLVSGSPLNSIKYFIPFLSTIESLCFDANHELFQYTFNNYEKPFSDLASYISSLDIDGIIMVECFDADFVHKVLNLKKPTVFVDFICARVSTAANYDIIGADNFLSAKDIVTKLVKKYSLNRFCFVGDIRHCKSFNDRYLGMITGLFDARTAHAARDDIMRDDGSFDYGSAESIKKEISRLKFMPECFVCGNDFIGRTVCDALALLGLSVPNDVLAVSFDNTPEAYSRAPKLTTFATDKKILGRETLRTLVTRIENPDTCSRNIALAARLIARDSTARPHGAT